MIDAHPELCAYALSFVIIAKTWLSHADFALFRRFSSTLAWMNLALLFFIAVFPAPTSVLSECGTTPHPWPSILFAAIIGANYLLLAGIWVTPARGAHGSGDGRACEPTETLRRLSVPAVFLLSIPAAFALNEYTPMLWLLLLPAASLSRRVSDRSRPQAQAQAQAQEDG